MATCAVACSSGTPSSATGPRETDGSVADVATPPADTETDATVTATQTVGASGGAVAATGVVLTIPAGALAADTTISVAATHQQAPQGYTALSPIFAFEPTGTTFLSPVTLEIKLATPTSAATIFWANASGGYDALPTTLTADGVAASITRLDDGFAGLPQSTSRTSDADVANEGGSGTDDAATDAGSWADAGITDAASTDEGVSDGGAPAISAMVDGTLTSFAYNTKATLLQSWWRLSADDNPSPTHWTLQLVVPTNASTATCQGGAFPGITYTHYTGASGDAGIADETYSTSTAASCTIDEATTATVQGQHAQGTFLGTVTRAGDAGTAANHALASGSYDVVVP
jgi:ZU5 domain